MKSLRMICRTFMDWLAHSMRFLPRSASSRLLTSDETAVLDIVSSSRSVVLSSQFLVLRRSLPGGSTGLQAGESVPLLFRRSAGRGHARRFPQLGGAIGGFPGEILVGATEMAVGGGLAVDRTTQLQGIDDAARGQLEIGADQ